MSKKPEILLRYILDSINQIEIYTFKITKAEFQKNLQIQDSVLRRLTIIGEAVKNLPETFRKKHKKTPWKQIAGMRDILIHEYFGVDMPMVWNTVKDAIPKFKKEVEKLLKP